MIAPSPIYDLVVRTLADLGVNNPEDIVPTLMIRDGSFLGHRFRYEGGYAVWWIGSPSVEFRDAQGRLVMMASVAGPKKGQAA
jgi:hypothetical protein